MAAEKSLVDYAPIISAILTLANLIIGASALAINGKLANDRDKRKEVRSRLDDLIERIEELESIAVRFHTAADFSPVDKEEIIYRLDRLAKLIQAVIYFKFNKDNQRTFNFFKQSIQLNNFNQSNWRNFSNDSEAIIEIRSRGSDLIVNLEELFDNQYPLEKNRRKYEIKRRNGNLRMK